MAGFSGTRTLYGDRSRTITFRNWPLVSSQPLKNSRFLKTRSRDRRIKPLRDGPISLADFFIPAFNRPVVILGIRRASRSICAVRRPGAEMVTRGKALYKRGGLRVLITIACTSSSKASLSKLPKNWVVERSPQCAVNLRRSVGNVAFSTYSVKELSKLVRRRVR